MFLQYVARQMLLKSVDVLTELLKNKNKQQKTKRGTFLKHSVHVCRHIMSRGTFGLAESLTSINQQH